IRDNAPIETRPGYFEAATDCREDNRRWIEPAFLRLRSARSGTRGSAATSGTVRFNPQPRGDRMTAPHGPEASETIGRPVSCFFLQGKQARQTKQRTTRPETTQS